MDLRQIIAFLRRWLWLLLVGAVLGGGAAFAASLTQDPVFRSSTKLMVSQPTESLAADLTSITDTELAETYRNMLVLEPVLEATEERTGFPVSAGQISSNIIEGTSLLNITVTDGDPERAATIANALVDSLIAHNETLQSSRFAASEESLQTQIAQVEGQMAEITAQQEAEGAQRRLTDEELAARQRELEREILALTDRAAVLQAEIADLDPAEDAARLPPLTRELLGQKQAEMTVLQLELGSAKAQYEALAAEGAPEVDLQRQEERVLGIADQIVKLEWEMEDINAGTGAPEIDLVTQKQISEKEVELGLLQLNLEITRDRYQQLLLTREDEESGSMPPSQGANLALYQQIYSSLLSNYEAVRLARLKSTPSIVQVDRALPGGPIQEDALQNALLGAAVGLIVMGGIAFLIEYLDDTLKSPEDIEALLGLAVIGYVAEMEDLSHETQIGRHSSGPFLSNNPRAPLGEAFRSLRTNLEFADVDQPLNTILVTSAGPSEGKTTIAANLAAAFGQQQKRVVMLDCDLRRPSLHKVFGISNQTGLSNVLLGQLAVQDCIYMFGGNLAVIPSGTLPSNPSEMLGSERMTQFLSEVGEVSDVIVIDSPPSIVSDAAVLSAKVDGVVLVIQPGSTRADDAAAQVEQLHRAGARVVGVVFNQIPRRQAGTYGRYGYKYSYYDYGQYAEDNYALNGRRRSRWSLWPFGRKGGGKPEEVIGGVEGDLSQ